jgi:sirohydrochlorin cobaltochelatase
MKTTLVLAMHGAPPTDYPQAAIGELISLHARLEHITGPERGRLEQRHSEIEAQVRTWPRTQQNDPFFAGSQELGEQLRLATRCDVFVGFNEFCAPSLDEALDQAVAGAAAPKRIVVITPMVTRGGEHSEVDIPSAIRRAQDRHPEIAIVYVWPLQASDVAAFLAAQIERQLERTGDFERAAKAV